MQTPETRTPDTAPGAAADTTQTIGGVPLPDQVATDWALYQGLPAAAQNGLWEIVRGCISFGDADQLKNRAEAFCRLYEIRSESLEAAVRVAHYLFSHAARLDLDESILRADLVGLGGDTGGIARLLTHFEEGKRLIREDIIRSTLLDHGKVLTTVHWRVDRLAASDRGQNLNAPIVHLTLGHRHGAEDGSTTLQLTPGALRELLDVCSRIEQGLHTGRPSSGHAPRPESAR